MRAVHSCFAILFSLLASADSNIGKLGQISQDLDERGLTPAHLTIEYSLTDDCNLADVRVIENSHQDNDWAILRNKTLGRVDSVFDGWRVATEEVVNDHENDQLEYERWS